MARDGQVDGRLSTLSLEFDERAFLEAQKARLLDMESGQAVLSLPEQQKSLLAKAADLERMRQEVSNAVFRDKKAALEEQIGTPWDTSGLDSLSCLLDLMRAREAQMDSLQNILSGREEELRDAMAAAEALAAQKKIYVESLGRSALPGQLAKHGGKLGKGQRLLLHLDKLKAGSFRMADSPFSVNSVPLNGLSFSARKGLHYISASFGVEGRQRRNLPDYARNNRLVGEGRVVSQAKVGLGGLEESHLHLGVTHVKARGPDGSGASLPKRGVVVMLDARCELGMGTFLDASGAVSGADFSGRSQVDDLHHGLGTPGNRSNLAWLARFGWKNKGGTEVGVGYQSVGPGFVTLGNLFLLSGRNSLRFDLRQRAFKGKAEARATYIKGTSRTDGLYPGTRQDQCSGELSLRLGRRGGRAWASWAPTVFRQDVPGAGSALYELNLVTGGCQFVHGKKGQWLSFFQVSNNRNEARFGDTSITSGLWYGFFSLSFNNGRRSFFFNSNTGAELGIRDWLKDFSHEMGQTLPIGKRLELTHGAQLTKRFYEPGVFWGLSAGIKLTAGGRFKAGCSATGLRAADGAARDRFYVSTSIGYRF